MAFNKHGKQAEPGQVSQSGRQTEHEWVDGGQSYPGYTPQRYHRPVMGYEHSVESSHEGNFEYEGGHVPGDGTVPNNTWRGQYGHGVIVDSDTQPQDHSRHHLSDDVPQVMPEADDQREMPPVKVEIVNRDPDQMLKPTIITVQLGEAATTTQGSPTANGLTPVRLLGRDPHRKRAYVYVPNFVSGGNNALGNVSTPVMMTSVSGLPQYGFALSLTFAASVELNTTEEIWVCGQNAADTGVVCAYIERAVNADPLHKD